MATTKNGIGYSPLTENFYLGKQNKDKGIWIDDKKDITNEFIDVKVNLTMKQILEYECHSNWLVGWISFDWGQKLMGWVIARRVSRKYNRYLRSIKNLECVKKIYPQFF